MSIFCAEIDNGNILYKLTLENFDIKKIIKYTTQLKYRVLEGYGKAIYIIGISDKGTIIGLNEPFPIVINKLHLLCRDIDCRLHFILKCNYQNKMFLIVKICSNFNVYTLPFII